MKCPKCGYVSFDTLETCRQCNTDLTETRRMLGFEGFPSFSPEPLLQPVAVAPAEEPEPVEQEGEEPETGLLFDEELLDDLEQPLEVGVADEFQPLETEPVAASLSGGELSLPDEPLGGEDEIPFSLDEAEGPVAAESPFPAGEIGDHELPEFEVVADADLDLDSALPTTEKGGERASGLAPEQGQAEDFELEDIDDLDLSLETESGDLDFPEVEPPAAAAGSAPASAESQDDLVLPDEEELTLELESSEKAKTTPASPEPGKAGAKDLEELSDDEILDAIPDLDLDDETDL